MKMKSILTTVLVTLALAFTAFAQNSNQFFSVTAPVQLVASAPDTGTTDKGVKYTVYPYTAELPNTDIYMVEVSVYPFPVASADLQRCGDAFVAGLSGTVKVDSTDSATVGGQPGLYKLVAVTSGGRAMRLVWVGTYKDNRFYQFIFGSYTDVQSDDAGIETFFKSITLK